MSSELRGSALGLSAHICPHLVQSILERIAGPLRTDTQTDTPRTKTFPTFSLFTWWR